VLSGLDFFFGLRRRLAGAQDAQTGRLQTDAGSDGPAQTGG
jgi:hypothetical protein